MTTTTTIYSEIYNCESFDSDSSDKDHEEKIPPSHLNERANLLQLQSGDAGRAESRETRSKPNSSDKKKKRRPRKKVLSVCLTSCRYEVIRKVAQQYSLKEVGEAENWNLYWTDLSISIERCKEMKRFQKINHFPGMLEICRKDLLCRNLNRMLKLFPKDYNFFPKTWCLPADLGDALAYGRLRKNKTFILKPDAGSQGKGISITKTLKEVKPTERMICQVYIARPFLIDGYKFDLRVYTLITSCDPLRVYIYNEGLVRFATSRYKEPTGVNISNVFMHLTNYAVNKYSRTYNTDNESGSKRKLSWFNSYMRSLGHDVTRLWQKIDDVIIKTILSAWPVLKHSYHACFPGHDIMPACCELLGTDIILDRRLCPQILEVNHSPSFHTDSQLDAEVKEALISDMFAMLNLAQCDKRKVMREDRRRVQDRLLSGINSKETTENQPVPSFETHYDHEYNHRGGYRLVFPNPLTEHLYHKYFQQGQCSLYGDTAASRARETAQTQMRDEMKERARIEASKRITSAQSQTQSPQSALRRRPSQQNMLLTTCSSLPINLTASRLPVDKSFLPQIIVEAEENDRLAALASRDFLVKSHGVVELIYYSLKRNGFLRPEERKKYALFDKAKNSASVDTSQGSLKSKTAPILNQAKVPAIRNMLDFDNGDGLEINCEQVQIYTRPDLPSVWGKLNKSHLARTLTNSMKVQADLIREMKNAQV